MTMITIIQGLFSFYTILLFGRIALSYLPSLYKYKASHFLVLFTDPYMNIFKKIIPPINGVLDLSPMLAFFSLRFLETFIISMIR